MAPVQTQTATGNQGESKVLYYSAFFEVEPGFDHSDPGMLQEDIEAMYNSAVEHYARPRFQREYLTSEDIKYIKFSVPSYFWRLRRDLLPCIDHDLEEEFWLNMGLRTVWMKGVTANIIKDYFIALTTARYKYHQNNPDVPRNPRSAHARFVDGIIEWTNENAPHLAPATKVTLLEELEDLEPGEIYETPEERPSAAKPAMSPRSASNSSRSDVLMITPPAASTPIKKRCPGPNVFIPRKSAKASPMRPRGKGYIREGQEYSPLRSAADSAQLLKRDEDRKKRRERDYPPSYVARSSASSMSTSSPYSTASSAGSFRNEPFRGPMLLRRGDEDEAEWRLRRREVFTTRQANRNVQISQVFEIGGPKSGLGARGKDLEQRILDRNPGKTSASLIDVVQEMEREDAEKAKAAERAKEKKKRAVHFGSTTVHEYEEHEE